MLLADQHDEGEQKGHSATCSEYSSKKNIMGNAAFAYDGAKIGEDVCKEVGYLTVEAGSDLCCISGPEPGHSKNLFCWYFYSPIGLCLEVLTCFSQLGFALGF